MTDRDLCRENGHDSPLPGWRLDARILVAGGECLIGRSLIDELASRGFHQVINLHHDEPDYSDRSATRKFFNELRPEFVFAACGRSAGIRENQHHPVELMESVLSSALHVISAARDFHVRKLLYFGSSCGYPRECPQPMAESSLLSGVLEPTSKPYAVARLAGMELCLAHRREFGSCFITAIPANGFGPGDDFDPQTGHVVGALIARMRDARERSLPHLTVWGSGKAERDFLFSRDLADAAIFLMEKYDDERPINISAATTMSIGEMALRIRDAVGYRGEILFDRSKPDGSPRKILDASLLGSLGWTPRFDIDRALRETVAWHEEQLQNRNLGMSTTKEARSFS